MSIDDRTNDLILAVNDLASAGSGGPVQSIANASSEHRALFDVYVRDLHEAKRAADSWWQDILDTETSRIGDRREAEINLRLRRPAGCVVHPRVIHNIRYYWLACSRRNEDFPPQERVAPVAFVLLWLEQSGERDLAEFIATIPYWPIGMDENGNWI